MVLIDKLGNYIERLYRPNSDLRYGIDDVCGITNTKKLVLGTKANLIGRTFEKFSILAPREFIFNRRTSRNGERISLGYNTTVREWILTEDYCHFRVRKDKEDVLDPDFLYLFFLDPEFDRYARFNSWGSATEFFNWEEMIETPIPVLPIDEQRKIVHDYQVITDRIELLRKIDNNLADQMKSLYRYFFINYGPFKGEVFKTTKIGEIPSSWKTGKLSEICEMLNGRAYSQDEMLTEGKYKLLRVGNFFTNDYWYYSDLELEPNKYCYPGDLLFCWAATLGLYIWNEPKTIYHYHIWKVDFSRSSSLFREYVYLCLSNEIANMKNAGHGSIMLHLTKENVENMEIVIPIPQVIKEFHELIEPYINQRNTIQKELDALSHLRTEMLANWHCM